MKGIYRYRMVILMITVVTALVSCGSRGYGADVEFRWAIMADSNTGLKSLDFSTTPVVHSGTALQIYLEHLENCHIYLYLLDSVDNLTPLYPTASGYYNYGFPRGPTFIPPGDRSFSFVPPGGEETFYLLASAQRLFKLEQLTDIFLQNPKSVGQRNLLIQEIEELLKGKEKKSAASENITSINRAPAAAKGDQNRAFQAVEVDKADFYGRKLLIDHQ